MHKITILNTSSGVVGLPNYQVFRPGETATLEVNDNELELWRNCSHVSILDTTIERPGGGVPGLSHESDNPGRLLKNNEMGSPPGSRRVGRPRKAQPGDARQPGPDGAENGVVSIHNEPGLGPVQGTAENLIDDTADAWPLPNVGQGGEFNGGGASGEWQEQPLNDAGGDNGRAETVTE